MYNVHSTTPSELRSDHSRGPDSFSATRVGTPPPQRIHFRELGPPTSPSSAESMCEGARAGFQNSAPSWMTSFLPYESEQKR